MSIATTVATRIGGHPSGQFDRLIRQATSQSLVSVNMDGLRSTYLFSDNSALCVCEEFDNGFSVGAPPSYEPPQTAPEETESASELPDNPVVDNTVKKPAAKKAAAKAAEQPATATTTPFTPPAAE